MAAVCRDTVTGLGDKVRSTVCPEDTGRSIDLSYRRPLKICLIAGSLEMSKGNVV